MGRAGCGTLNQQKSLSAINNEMDPLLAKAWEQVEADNGIWILALGANGERAFRARGDMRSSPTGSEGGRRHRAASVAAKALLRISPGIQSYAESRDRAYERRDLG